MGSAVYRNSNGGRTSGYSNRIIRCPSWTASVFRKSEIEICAGFSNLCVSVMSACSGLFREFTCLFIFLCSCTSNLIYAKSFEYRTSVLSSAWNISPSDIEPITFKDGSILRPVFVRKFRGPAFACGFYSIDFSKSYLLAIFATFTNDTEDASPIGYLDTGFPQVVWSANRNHLVGIMASLQLTTEEGLVLTDADGSVAWSINTLGKSVSGLNLTDEGNLVLFDERNMTIWQSFDHPTDSLVISQKLKVGQKLVPSISPTNCTANGLISLSLTSRGLYAQMETNPPQIYYPVRFDFPNTGNESNYLQFQKGLLSMFKNYSRNSTLFPSIPFSTQFLRLDVDGHLRAYSWVTFQWTALDDLLIRDYGDCGYPTVCGRYGICSSMGQCSCLPPVGGTTYFVQTDYKQPKLGCSEIVPLSCGASENQSFVEITDITYFTYSTDSESVPDASNIDSESCKAACAKNCSCKAVFFQGLAGVRDGSCYYISEVFSLMNVDLQNTSSVYIKVQNVPATTNVSTGQKNHVRSIVGFFLGSVFALIIVVAATILFPKRREQDMYEVEEDYLDQVPGMPTRFRYDDLKAVTADFSKKLGQGGFGAVYHGILMDGTKIAVKCLNDLGQIKKSFLAEVKTIGSIHHVSLVRLVGFCAEKSHRLLVYEFMPHGSLDRWIYSTQSDNPLDWQRRKKIILDIAKGLNYLHEDCRQKIIHLDIKPQNILLDGNFGAKVADFGLSKLADRDESQVVTTMRGTPGYLAPEWLSAVITEKVDVYAFGVVILEIVCGRRAFDHSQSREDTHLVCLFRRKVEENHLLEIIDERISCTQSNSQEAVDTMKIAAWCLQGDSTKRPSMSTVIKVLDGVSEVPDDLDYNFPFSSPERESFLTNGEFCGTSSPRLPSVLSNPRKLSKFAHWFLHTSSSYLSN